MNNIVFDNDDFLSDNIIIGDSLNEELRETIIEKIWSFITLSQDELDYLKVCRDLFNPKDKKELSDILYYFFKQNIVYLNCINVSNITDMQNLFQDLLYVIEQHNDDIIHLYIDDWDVSNVVRMDSMFTGYKKYTFDVSKWNVSNVTHMNNMFNECRNFNSDLSKWNVSNVRTFDGMFYNCKKFTSDLSNWKLHTKDCVSMVMMFYGCENFTSNLSRWDVSKVIYMRSIFYGCKKFDSDLSNWNVSNTTAMGYMFYDCENFNSDLSKWDISKCQNMHKMFFNCHKFNQDLSNWVFNGIDSVFMFYGCPIKNEYKPKYIDYCDNEKDI